MLEHSDLLDNNLKTSCTVTQHNIIPYFTNSSQQYSEENKMAEAVIQGWLTESMDLSVV